MIKINFINLPNFLFNFYFFNNILYMFNKFIINFNNINCFFKWDTSNIFLLDFIN